MYTSLTSYMQDLGAAPLSPQAAIAKLNLLYMLCTEQYAVSAGNLSALQSNVCN